jgi:rhodanese-related sulfurtransferase
MTAAVVRVVSPQDLRQRLEAGEMLALVDVRTPAEFRECHAAPARNVPLDELSGSNLDALCRQASSQTLYLLCQKGGRGQKACEKLLAAGATNVANVEGGTLAWEQAGLPVVRGKKTISLERQVRIAAGSLVLVGALLAWFVHPAFVGLSAFIGAGLVFAGVTDTCGMGMLLAKCAWNKS